MKIIYNTFILVFSMCLSCFFFSGNIWADEVDTNFIIQHFQNRLLLTENILKENAIAYREIIHTRHTTPLYDNSIYFKTNPNSTFTDHNHISKSTFYLSASKPINRNVLKFIKDTEWLEQQFEKNLNKYPFLGWQYIVEYKYGGMRLFPWFNAEAAMGSYLDWSSFEFFTRTKTLSSDNKMICAELGMDVAGLGYISSCTLPIMDAGKNIGLLGIDIKIDSTFNEVVDRMGSGMNHFVFVVAFKNQQILFKPIFFELLYPHIFNLKDLDCNVEMSECSLENKQYRILLMPVDIAYLNDVYIMEFRNK